jgi:hypothetical protein
MVQQRREPGRLAHLGGTATILGRAGMLEAAANQIDRRRSSQSDWHGEESQPIRDAVLGHRA